MAAGTTITHIPLLGVAIVRIYGHGFVAMYSAFFTYRYRACRYLCSWVPTNGGSAAVRHAAAATQDEEEPEERALVSPLQDNIPPLLLSYS